MPSPARPPAHVQLSGSAPQGPGLAVDPLFTAADFNVKDWINAVFASAQTHQNEPGPASSSPIGTAALSPPSSSGASGGLKPSVSSASLDSAADASLDASLDLLQTPAMDPVLDDAKGQGDQDSLSSSRSVTSIPSTSGQQHQQQQSSAAAIASKSRGTHLTQHATTQLTKLHLLAGQTSAALASTTQDMVKLLPRLTYELDQLRQETKTLQEGIRIVRNDINSVDSADTTLALDRLKYLDLVKTRMESTHAALREAENWRNLEAEANDILAKGDFTRAATRLSEAERSLVVYKNTNVEGDRMELLLVLKNQLEQQVMGKVKEALEQKDTAACQNLIDVFALIGRQEKFQEYYISQRREPLLEQWRNLTGAMNIGIKGPASTKHQGSSARDIKDFVNVLQTFYKDASNMLHDEFAWITSIFSDPVATIHSLVQDIFSNIDPSMQAALQHISKTQGDEASLPILITAFTAAESFGTRMERIISQPLVGYQREHSGSKESQGPHIARSSTGVESLRLGSVHDPHEWAYVLYEPFMHYQQDYGKLEGAHLRALLAKSVPAMATFSDNVTKNRELARNSSHLVEIMTNTNKLAFSLAEGAIGRCMRLTHGFGAPGLLDGLNGFFQDIMDRYIEILIEYRRKSGLQVDEPSHTKQQDIGRSSPRVGAKYGATQDEEDEDSDGWDGGVNEQDQRRILMGLRLMALCRQLCQKLEQLSTKTKKALRGVEDLIRTDSSDQDLITQGSQHQHHHSAIATLSSTLEHSAGTGQKSTTHQSPPNASIALLQQSSLNSFRILEVLDIVKKSNPEEEHAMTSLLEGDGSLERISVELDLGLEPKANHLFLQSHQSAVHLTKLCQRFIFDSMYLPLVRPLSDLASLSCWTEGIEQSGDDASGTMRRVHQSTMGGTRTDVIRFRSSPNEYMEELLRQLNGLPLGTYEGDTGLRFGVHLLPYADQPLFRSQESAEQQPSSSPGSTGADGVGVGKSNNDDKGLGVGEAGTTTESVAPKGDAPSQGLEDPVEEEDALVVMHRWITSVSRAVMHAIIERLYNPHWEQSKESQGTSTSTPPLSSRSRFGIGSSLSPAPASTTSLSSGHGSKERHYLTRLSDAGAKQLELDLVYFVETYLGSLGIEPTPSFRALIKALRLSESGLSMALQQVQQQREELQQQVTGESHRDPKDQVSLVFPGAPILPTALVVAEEDLIGQLDVEQKVLEWVARLKGIDMTT